MNNVPQCGGKFFSLHKNGIRKFKILFISSSKTSSTHAKGITIFNVVGALKLFHAVPIEASLVSQILSDCQDDFARYFFLSVLKIFFLSLFDWKFTSSTGFIFAAFMVVSSHSVPFHVCDSGENLPAFVDIVGCVNKTGPCMVPAFSQPILGFAVNFITRK